MVGEKCGLTVLGLVIAQSIMHTVSGVRGGGSGKAAAPPA